MSKIQICYVITPPSGATPVAKTYDMPCPMETFKPIVQTPVAKTYDMKTSESIVQTPNSNTLTLDQTHNPIVYNQTPYIPAMYNQTPTPTITPREIFTQTSHSQPRTPIAYTQARSPLSDSDPNDATIPQNVFISNQYESL